MTRYAHLRAALHVRKRRQFVARYVRHHRRLPIRGLICCLRIVFVRQYGHGYGHWLAWRWLRQALLGLASLLWPATSSPGCFNMAPAFRPREAALVVAYGVFTRCALCRWQRPSWREAANACSHVCNARSAVGADGTADGGEGIENFSGALVAAGDEIAREVRRKRRRAHSARAGIAAIHSRRVQVDDAHAAGSVDRELRRKESGQLEVVLLPPVKVNMPYWVEGEYGAACRGAR